MIDDRKRLLDVAGIALAVVVVVSLALLALSSLSAQQPATELNADWTLSRVNESHVRIAHAGGEPVTVANLTVAVDGRPRHPAWTDETLTEGEYGVVHADTDATVVLFWERETAKRRTLERWHPSDSNSE